MTDRVWWFEIGLAVLIASAVFVPFVVVQSPTVSLACAAAITTAGMSVGRFYEQQYVGVSSQ